MKQDEFIVREHIKLSSLQEKYVVIALKVLWLSLKDLKKKSPKICTPYKHKLFIKNKKNIYKFLMTDECSGFLCVANIPHMYIKRKTIKALQNKDKYYMVTCNNGKTVFRGKQEEIEKYYKGLKILKIKEIFVDIEN